jgi:hypothetical protein
VVRFILKEFAGVDAAPAALGPSALLSCNLLLFWNTFGCRYAAPGMVHPEQKETTTDSTDHADRKFPICEIREIRGKPAR